MCVIVDRNIGLSKKEKPVIVVGGKKENEVEEGKGGRRAEESYIK